MKYRSISKERRVLSSPASETLRRFTAADPSLENSSLKASPAAPASVPFVEYWKKPESIMALAKRAGARAAKSFVKYTGNLAQADMIEDASQEVAVEFFELSDFERPKTENEFEVWAFQRARTLLARLRAVSWYETCDELIGADGLTYLRSDIEASDRFTFSIRPHQLIHMEFLDAIRKIDAMGEEDRRLIYSVLKAGDVVGYSEDNGVSLFDAMDRLVHCRLVMNRIADDEADEKKFTIAKVTVPV